MSPERELPVASPAESSAEVCLLQPGEESEWDRFVLRSSCGTLFHLCGWKAVVEKTLKHRSFCLVARGERGITGIFPMSLVRSRLFGNSLVSMPLAVYGGICADDEASYLQLLAAGTQLASRLGVNYLEMRNREEMFPTSLPGRDLYVTFTQDLRAGAEKLMQGLPRDTRHMIRKAQKAGLVWTDDLTPDEFYEIYARSVHNLGTPVFPRELFMHIRAEFASQCRLFGVRKEGRAIAGVLCLYFKNQVLPYYAGALREYFKYAPNNFMYWNLIAQSCGEGLEHFDFGRSKLGTGSFQFKSAWAMQTVRLPYRYQLIRSKQVPHLSPIDQKFRLAVALWRRLPFSWTKLLGPRVIRWVPSL